MVMYSGDSYGDDGDDSIDGDTIDEDSSMWLTVDVPRQSII